MYIKPSLFRLLAFSPSLFFVLFLTGCNSGSSSSPETPIEQGESLQGQFVDNDVAGIRYQTATREGFTDSEGFFDYLEGEVVTFSIGSITFPSVVAKSVITPLDLVGETDLENLENQEAINIARLLQSLDSDGDTSNGIQISDESHEQLSNPEQVLLNFDISATEFETQASDLLQSLPEPVTLISEKEAITHLQETVASIIEENSDDYVIRRVYKSSIEELSDQVLEEDGGGILIKIQDAETAEATTALYSIKSLDEAIFPESGVSLETNQEGTMLSLTPLENTYGEGRFILTEVNGPLVRTRVFTVDVLPVNDSPTITSIPDQSITARGEDIVISFDVGDIETGTDGLSLVARSSNTNVISSEQITLSGEGLSRTVTVNTSSGESGTTQIVLTVSDGELSSEVQFDVTIDSANTAPTSSPLSFSTELNTRLEVSIADTASDIDEDTLTFEAGEQTGSGSFDLNSEGLLSFTPEQDSLEASTLNYFISDGLATTEASLTVSIVLPPPPDQDNDGIIDSEDNCPSISNADQQDNNENGLGDACELIANADFLETDEDTSASIDVLANDSSPVGSQMMVTQASASNGTVDISANPISYTPSLNFYGSDTITYTVQDTTGQSASSTVAVIINPVNDAPITSADALTLDEDTSGSIDLSTVLSNDSDPDGDTLSVVGVSAETGSAQIIGGLSIEYTPTSNYFGNDTLTYTIEDGQGASATGQISVTVNGINDAPVLTDALSFETEANTAFNDSIASTASDIEDDPLSFYIVSRTGGGTFELTTAGGLSFTPSTDFSGDVDLNYRVNDGQDDSFASLTVTVLPPPPDQDEDGTPDSEDNCPSTYNPSQADNNGDGTGNACEMLADQVFPDTQLRSCVESSYAIATTFVVDVTSLSCSESGISSTAGIDQLFALTSLELSYHGFSSIDLSENAALTSLDLTGNSLTSINISHLTSLTSLSLGSNNLSAIDVSDLTSLRSLTVRNNNLTSLNVTANTLLTDLSIGNNSLSTIDLSANTLLEELRANSNSFSSIDLANNDALTYLDIDTNSLTSISLAALTQLVTVDLRNNSLSTIDLSNNPLLDSLNLNTNNLTSINVDNNLNLNFMDMRNNPLSTATIEYLSTLSRIPSLFY